MTNIKYTKKETNLLDTEIFDFDTKNQNETGINVDRAILPKRYDIMKHYQHFKDGSGRGRFIKNKNAPDFSSDFEWQITYRFPDGLRQNYFNGHKYGGDWVTFRRLYLILCEHFNGGNYFIEDYFNTVYPYTMKEFVDSKLGKLKEQLLDIVEAEIEMQNIENSESGMRDIKVTKRGTLNKNYSVVNRGMEQRLKEYDSFAESMENEQGEEIARIIKDDIKNCLADGRIPLRHINATSTMIKREKAGLPDSPEFYASGQLIDSLILYVNIGGNGQWQTQSGLLV